MSLLKECLNGQNKKHKIVNCISFTTIGMAFFLIVLFFYWLLFPYKPLVINEKPMEVLDKEVKVGGIVQYEIDYCKNTNLPAHVNKKFSDGIEFALPEYEVSNPAGCRTQTIVTEIPKTLPSGGYIIVAQYKYKVNPIREITIKAHTQKFSVTN